MDLWHTQPHSKDGWQHAARASTALTPTKLLYTPMKVVQQSGKKDGIHEYHLPYLPRASTPVPGQR